MNKGTAFLQAILIYILPLVFISAIQLGTATLLVREGQITGRLVVMSILGQSMLVLFYHACLCCSNQGCKLN